MTDNTKYSRLRVFTAAFSMLVAGIWWMLALFSRSYHYLIVSFPIGNYLSMDISLWNIWASSDCNPTMLNGRLNFDFCRWVISNVDGYSIGEVMRFLCLRGYGLASEESDCTTFSNLYTASAAMISSIIIIIALLVSASSWLVILYYRGSKKKIKAIVLTQLLLASAISMLALFLYTSIGGFQAEFNGFGNSIRTNRLSSLFFNSTTLNSGFYISMVASAITIFLIPWINYIIKNIEMEGVETSSYVSALKQTYYNKRLEDEITETERLIHKLRTGPII
ncbi:putative signal peptide-containing protein [Cryptosporidium canis]|uniref:Signal peptide-containing protein n=1 Tax=Cryptosporidium canis TaxID=195482 RepID=A0ABQ8P7U8_9CRYT|nr:putative signal peptide-containing protein [Cryptosporidium canis]